MCERPEDMIRFCALCFAVALAFAARGQTLEPQPQWGDFAERNFPFFSSVLDARKLGPGFPADNLTPRGLILNLGHDAWACFVVDR